MNLNELIDQRLHSDRDKPLTVYIAGPMRGYPRFNFDAFDAAAEMLQDTCDVISPAQLDRDIGLRS